MVTVYNQIFLHAGRGYKLARRGGEIKDNGLTSNSCNASKEGSVTMIVDGAFMGGSAAMVRGQRFLAR